MSASHTVVRSFVLVVLAAAILYAAAAVRSVTVETAGKPTRIQKPVTGKVTTYSTDTPVETPPPAGYDWRGADYEPKRISLPTIQSEGFLQSVGTDQNNQIAVPGNIHVAGWFVNSVRPGNLGLSIIDGHVNGRVNDGIFKQLGKMEIDDEFSLELGSGKILTYKVKSVVSVDVAKANEVLFSQDPKAKSQLNLITCGGTFDRTSKQYLQRVIVAAELISES